MSLPKLPPAHCLRGLLPAALGLALLAGCGGDSQRAAFVARSDRVCSAARARARAITPVADNASPAAQAGYLRRVVPAARSEVSDLQALPAPQNDAAAVASYLKAQLGQIAAIERAAAALSGGDAAGARTDFQAALGLAPHIQALARQAGYRVCGSEFS